MIDFTTVSREFRSLVTRRRALLTFLGSVFAALGIFLRNALKGELPDQLAYLNQHAFAFYAVALMVPCLVLALRIARLHGGMVLNGMLYAQLMRNQEFTRKGDPERAGRHNFASVSFLFFLLSDLLAAFSAALFGLALWQNVVIAVALALAVLVGGLLVYFRFHRQAVRFARAKIQSETSGSVSLDEWQSHMAGSLEDANHDMITVIAFVGLMVFSVFESLSGLGGVIHGSDFDAPRVREAGAPVYATLMVVTAIMGLAAYLRLRIAVGHLSLQIDPTDRPFRPLRLTDSLLGYLLLTFLFAISVYVLLGVLWIRASQLQLGLITGIAALIAVAFEQGSLIWCGMRSANDKK